MSQEFQILVGSALDLVARIPKVHTVITSPPYFQKRKYGDSVLEFGQTRSVDEFISQLVTLFGALPLHPLGSLWVNLGDTRGDNGLLMVPERFAFAMVQSGWALVDHVVWAKVVAKADGETLGHCMIEPAKGRLNGNGHESLFRFVRCKPKKAWSDSCAVSLPRNAVPDIRYLPKENMAVHTSVEGRCLQNVWLLPPGGSRHEHFATYSPSLCERPIALSCPMRVCSVCGHLRTRKVEMVPYEEGKTSKRIFGKYTKGEGAELQDKAGRMDAGRHYVPKKPVTVGWTDCGHSAWEPGVVLDPFCGSGTTGVAALKMGRRFIGVELYQAYADIGIVRCNEVLNKLGHNPFDLEK